MTTRRVGSLSSWSVAALLVALLTACGDGGSGGGSGGSGATVTIQTTSLPFGLIGQAYSGTLVATGATAPVNWAVIGNSLPLGLTLNSTTGQITGTPTTVSTSTLTFRVQDALSRTATSPIILIVNSRTDRVSVDNNTPPNPGNGASTEPRISGTNGRFIVFASQATNLLNPLAAGTPAVSGIQIYIRDRQTGQTFLVSKDNNLTPNPGNGSSSAPTISADGRFVAFISNATNLLNPLASGTPAPSGQQIYMRDLTLNQTTLVSKDNNLTPNPGNGVSSEPTISGDGRFVGFTSDATNLLNPPVPGTPAATGQQIYLRDRTGNQTSLVSKDNSTPSNPGNGTSSTPAILADGSSVTFVSVATNLVSGATVASDIYTRALP